MKIAIIGATGFIGSALCSYLAKEGHEIFAIAQNHQKFTARKIPGCFIHASFKKNDDYEWIEKIPHNIDAIINTIGVMHSFDLGAYYNVNYRKQEKLLSELSKRFKHIRYIHFSSQVVNGPSLNMAPVPEETVNPISEHGHSKYLGELLVTENTPNTWSKLILRPALVIGPNAHSFYEILKMISHGVAIIPGKDGGNKQFSFVAIHDLVKIVNKLLTITYIAGHDIYNIAHPKPFSYNRLISLLQKNLDKKRITNIFIPNFMLSFVGLIASVISKLIPRLELRLNPDLAREIRQKAWILSTEKLLIKQHVTYDWDLEKIIVETCETYKKRK